MITNEEQKRYHRQLLMLGEAGQERLKAARVLIAGAGGLGTVIATYLAAAGIGTLRIADCDVVEATNLNRQILHWGGDVGRPKTASVAEKLSALNALIRVEEITGRIDEASIDAWRRIATSSSTRWTTSRRVTCSTGPPSGRGFPSSTAPCAGCRARRRRCIPGKTPCLRCLFPQSPPSELFPIIGATCGVIGSIEATEAVKLLTGQGEPLAGRLLIWDGLRRAPTTLVIERNPACPDCGPSGQAT